jgi:hypothetical protein
MGKLPPPQRCVKQPRVSSQAVISRPGMSTWDRGFALCSTLLSPEGLKPGSKRAPPAAVRQPTPLSSGCQTARIPACVVQRWGICRVSVVKLICCLSSGQQAAIVDPEEPHSLNVWNRDIYSFPSTKD